jgi:hypothetical protein
MFELEARRGDFTPLQHKTLNVLCFQGSPWSMKFCLGKSISSGVAL